LVVLCGGLGWLLQLTQGHSLCIPASPRLAVAHPGPIAARWQGLQTTSHPHDLNVLPAGSLDPCREGAITWQMGEAQEACLRFSVAAGLLPALHGTTANCPPLHICIPDTLGSYVSRIVRKRPHKSKSASTDPEPCRDSCTSQQSTAAEVSGRGCLLGWNPTAAYLAGTHRARN